MRRPIRDRRTAPGRPGGDTKKDFSVVVMKATPLMQEKGAAVFARRKQELVILFAALSFVTLLTSALTAHFSIANNDRSGRPNPIAYIHVGPRKTGSTAIQQMLIDDAFKRALLRDGIAVPVTTTHHFFRECLQEQIGVNTIPCDEAEKRRALNEIEMARKTRQNILFSCESLDELIEHGKEAFKVLDSAFEGFDVRIIIVHRHLYDWLPSLHGQKYCQAQMFADASWDVRPEVKYSIADWVTHKTRSFKFAMTRSPLSTFQKYASRYGHENVSFVIPYAERYDVVPAFYCLDTLQAPRACRAAKQAAGQDDKANVGKPLDYDILAMTAMDAGLIDKLSVTRVQARTSIQLHQEQISNQTGASLPRLCPSKHAKKNIFELSLDQEQKVSALASLAWHEDDRKHYRNEFEAIWYSKFCSVDTDRVLSDKDWRDFFSRISDPSRVG